MHFYALVVGNKFKADEFEKKARCYNKKMHDYLYNESTGLYSDFMSM